MRSYDNRLKRIEERLKPKDTDMPVIVECEYPGHREAELKELRKQGKKILQLQIVSHDNFEAWQEYNKAEEARA